MTALEPQFELELPSELYVLAIEVFATEAKALEWLQRPHPQLDGSTSLAVAQTSSGAQPLGSHLNDQTACLLRPSP